MHMLLTIDTVYCLSVFFPHVFKGLHNNADLTYRMKEASETLGVQAMYC